MMRTSGRPVGSISRRGGCGGGCVVVAVIFIVVLVVAGIYVANNWRGWVAGAAEQGMREFLTRIDVPQNEKDRMSVLVDAVLTDFKAKQINVEQLERLAQSFERSPLIPMGMMLVAEASYVGPREWPAEEKEAARRTLERLTRGLVEETIPAQRMDDVLAPISVPAEGGDAGTGTPGGGPWNDVELKDPSQVTDEELREFLALAKAEADRAQVPDEPYEISLAGELERVIVEGLGRPLPPATRAVASQIESPADPAPLPDAGSDAGTGGGTAGGEDGGAVDEPTEGP